MNSLLVINTVICIAVFWHAICSLNIMPKTTKGWEPMLLKWFYITLGTSAALVCFGPLYGYWEPQLGEVLITSSFLGINLLSVYQKYWRKSRRDKVTQPSREMARIKKESI